MAILDIVLNCLCLLLWLNSRSRGLTGIPRVPGVALVGTLKRAERRTSDAWSSGLVLLVVLFLRAILYWQVGSALRWTPSIGLGPVALHFRSDMFSRMVLFSLLGFAMFLAGFYFSLFLLAAVNRRQPSGERWPAMVRGHLGALARLPAWLMLLAPPVVLFSFWMTFGYLFAALQLVAPVGSLARLALQASFIGLSAWLLWQYVVGAILVLHILSSYIYLGRAPLWSFVNATAGRFLRPLSFLPLRIRKFDLAPFLALGLLVLAVWLVPEGLGWLYARFAS